MKLCGVVFTVFKFDVLFLSKFYKARGREIHYCTNNVSIDTLECHDRALLRELQPE